MHQGQRQFYGLNLFRFPASIAIVIYHYPLVCMGAHPGIRYSIMSNIYSYASLGVEVFFAISGFLLYTHYSQKIRDCVRGGFSTFILGRVIRIYPAMVLTTVLTAICLWLTVYFFPEGHLVSAKWATDAMHTTLVAFFMSVFGLQSGWISDRDHAAVYGASWYLSVLMICSLLFYFILRRCKGKRINENGCFIFLILFGAYLRINGGIAFPLMYSWCGRGYMSFFMGVLVAQLITKLHTDKQNQVLLLGSIVAILLYGVLLKIGCLGNLSVATSLVLCPALLIFLTRSKIISQISNNRIITYLGNISFEIYLWHQPVIIWLYFFQDLFHWNINYENKYVFFYYILLTNIVAAATFVLYERPLTRRWKTKLVEYTCNK